MTFLKIQDAPLKTSIVGDEKIPTGGYGDLTITVQQIKDFTGLAFSNVDNTADLDKPVSTATQAALDLKASVTYVDNANSLKADKTYVDSQDALKADKVYVDTQLQLKASKTYVDGQLSSKATNTYVDTINATKANVSYVDSELALKSDITYVDTALANKTHNSLVERDAVEAHPASAISDASGKTQQQINDAQVITNNDQNQKNSQIVSIKDFGAIGDGTLHTINEWITSGKYADLAAIQVDYPHVTALTDSIDWAAFQAALNSTAQQINVTIGNYFVNKTATTSSKKRVYGFGGTVTGTALNMTILILQADACEARFLDIDCNTKAEQAIRITGARCIVKNNTIRNGYSYNSSTQAISSVTSGGVTITDNEIYNMNAEKDVGSSATASARAIFHGVGVAETGQTLIANNVIRDIYGVEGDAIHVIFNGGGAHLNCKTTVQGNSIDGFSRRGIKIQANKAKIFDNVVLSNDLKSTYPNLNNGIDIQYSSECEVKGNTVDVLDCGCIQVYGGNTETLPNAKRNVVKNNTVYLRTPSNINGYAIYCERMYDSVIKDNYIYSLARGIGAGNSFDSSVSNNELVGGHASSIGISVTFSCGNLVIKDNNGLNFTCATFVRNQAKESIVKNNYTKIGVCAESSVDAVGSVYADNVSNNSTFTTSGTFTNQYIVNGGINMQGFNATPKEMYSTDIPSTTYPTLRFNRGDRVYKLAPAGTAGEVVSWVATANGVGTAANWKPLDTLA